MSNIKELIRQEIERLKKILEESTYYLDNSQQALGYSFALDDFKEFIDSLPEEKLSYVTDSPGDPGNPGEPGISDLEKAAEEYRQGEVDTGCDYIDDSDGDSLYHSACLADAFIAGAEWAFRQGWTFDAHKGAFGICFDGNIDNLLDSLNDKEEVTVQIRKK